MSIAARSASLIGSATRRSPSPPATRSGSPRAAGGQVGAVIANRTAIKSAIGSLRATTPRARTVVGRLRAAVAGSLAADRDYRTWLARLEAAGARCPLPRSGPYVAAAREDAQATRAKRRLVAAFNPMARAAHRRTWRAEEI